MHTPPGAPWGYFFNTDDETFVIYREGDRDDVVATTAVSGLEIEPDGSRTPLPEFEAEARLLAAAPCMAEALDYVLYMSAGAIDSDARVMARAALARARGDAQ